jgi:uncharacterized protein with PQ loop repeat
MLNFLFIKNSIGVLLVLTGILDAYKYCLQGRKIQKKKSAKNISRMFMNYAISQDITKLVYAVIIQDVYIFIISVLALGCMLYMWEMIRRYYPYRMRGCANFKRPNIITYFINSLLPNHLRKRL